MENAVEEKVTNGKREWGGFSIYLSDITASQFDFKFVYFKTIA